MEKQSYWVQSLKSFPWVLIVILLSVILLHRECSKVDPVDPVVIVDTIPGDVVTDVSAVPFPVPVYIDTGTTRWLKEPIDTPKVLREYYSKKVYQDTLKDDSSALVAVIDTVWNNSLSARILLFQNRRPISIIHNTFPSPQPDKTALYLGLAGIVSKEMDGIGPSVLLVTRNGYGYSYTYDLTNNGHQLSVFWKIGKRKIPP